MVGDDRKMADTTDVVIRLDTQLKEDAEELFAQFGMDMTTAVNLFIHQSLLHYKIPFEIKMPAPNAETVAAMMECERLSRDPNAKSFTTMEELMTDLLSDED